MVATPVSLAGLRPNAVTLRQLRAFVAVAKDGSITRAAQRLHLTPSALSMLVSGLENDLGVRLFERTTRRLLLTDAGRALLPAIEQVFERLDSAFDGLRNWADQRSTRLSIATSPLLAAVLVPTLMAALRERFPDVRFELQDLGIAEIAQAVRAGEADVGICTADTQILDLQATVLYQDRLVLACREDHPLAGQREVRWSDLPGQPLALMRRGSGLRQLVEQGLGEQAGQLHPAYEVAQVGTAVGLVEAGLAVAVLPWYALSSARAQSVRGVPLSAPVVERNIVALTAPERPLPEVGQAFLLQFQQHMKALEAGAGAARRSVRKSRA